MFSPIPEILDELRAGRMIVLVDDEDRENEGDLVLAAEFVTPEAVNALTRLAGGYLCLSLTEADCDRLNLHPQTAQNTTVRGTPFTVSIDAHPRHGVSTGISASDRATTIRLAAEPRSTADDFVRPGHINPLRSRDGGVLVRFGQTEGSVDLCRLAGLRPAALIIEIVREDGQMARRPELEVMCRKHGWKMCSVEQVIEHRLQGERLVKRMEPVGGVPIRTADGEFNLVTFASVVDPLPQLALTCGGVGELDARGVVKAIDEPVLVRMHRGNLLGDVFLDLASGKEGASGQALRASMRMIQKQGRGAVVYLRPRGGGDAYMTVTGAGGGFSSTSLSGAGSLAESTAPMLQRDFGIGVQALRELGLKKIRLLTNHPRDLPGLEAFGLEIVEHVPLGW
ncbi:MAG: 3,4-dihydroxy-2-butanone-4-phosphate synthase [Phycisphaerales bacterium]